MMPNDFIEFSKAFVGAFLAWINQDGPTMELTDFRVNPERVVIDPREYDPFRLPHPGEKVTLVFANPFYTDRCEMGIVKGIFLKERDRYFIEPYHITWTLSFDVDEYPERLVKRWKRQ